jgi:hypothetical protein
MFDEELLSGLGLSKLPLTKSERLKRIDTEMAAGFDSLRHIGRPVSFFGSSRIPRGHHDDEQTRAVAGRGGRAGFAVIT